MGHRGPNLAICGNGSACLIDIVSFLLSLVLYPTKYWDAFNIRCYRLGLFAFLAKISTCLSHAGLVEHWTFLPTIPVGWCSLFLSMGILVQIGDSRINFCWPNTRGLVSYIFQINTWLITTCSCPQLPPQYMCCCRVPSIVPFMSMLQCSLDPNPPWTWDQILWVPDSTGTMSTRKRRNWAGWRSEWWVNGIALGIFTWPSRNLPTWKGILHELPRIVPQPSPQNAKKIHGSDDWASWMSTSYPHQYRGQPNVTRTFWYVLTTLPIETASWHVVARTSTHQLTKVQGR